MTDAEVVARVLGGEPEAFAVLVDRYHADCHRFARHVLGNEHDAEDATQESFVRAYRALARYRERDLFRSWIFRILLNRCRNIARQRRRRQARFVEDSELVDLAASPAPQPEGMEDALVTALARLDARLREAFVLKHCEGMEYSEMARVTGAGISALKMRVRRAAVALRPQLEEFFRG